MRSIKNETNLQNKKILLRLDLNVPIVNGKITDTTRIDKILPTLKFLNKQKEGKIFINSNNSILESISSDLSKIEYSFINNSYISGKIIDNKRYLSLEYKNQKGSIYTIQSKLVGEYNARQLHHAPNYLTKND